MMDEESNCIVYRGFTITAQSESRRNGDTATIQWCIIAPDGRRIDCLGDSLSHARVIVDEQVSEQCRRIRDHLRKSASKPGGD